MNDRNGILTSNCTHRSLPILGIQVPDRLSNDQTQFHLIVHVYAARAQEGAASGEEDRRRRLQEEEGLLGACAGELRDVVAGVSS